jgi:pimeloyl-ACP methyl ester carboxylesterase
MSGVLIVILLLIAGFVLASVVLGRMTHEVGSAHDTEYLELEGSWVRYRVTGEGPPVVLVHGWLSSSRVWERLANRLAERFTVYTLDLKGFGESDKPASGYGIRYGSRLLYAFCAHFGLTRAAVVGHDIGGAMAVKLAADHQDVVGRLVLVATPAEESQIDLPTILWLATLPIVGPVFYTLGRLLRFLRRIWMRPFVFDPENLDEEVVEDAGKSTPAAATKTLDMVRRETARGRLTRQAGIIKVPVLAIAGEEDQIVDPQTVGDWAQTLSAEIVLLDECGHLPMLERPGIFGAQVLAFLTGDHRYLEAATEFQEEVGRKDRDSTVAETSEGATPLSRAEPGGSEPGGSEPGDSEASPPDFTRRRDSSGLPPRNRSPEETEDRDNALEPPSERAAERDPDPAFPDVPDEKRPRSEERPQGHVDRAGGDSDAGGLMPELPKDLFEWPESLKEYRTQDRPPETDRQFREEPGEDTERPEDPEKEPGP